MPWWPAVWRSASIAIVGCRAAVPSIVYIAKDESRYRPVSGPPPVCEPTMSMTITAFVARIARTMSRVAERWAPPMNHIRATTERASSSG